MMAELFEELDKECAMNLFTDSGWDIAKEKNNLNETWMNDSQKCFYGELQCESENIGGVKRKAEDLPQQIGQSPKRSRKQKEFFVMEQLSETMTVREAQYLVAHMILSRCEKQPLRIKLKDSYIKAYKQSFENQDEENGKIYQNL
jgi:hypothetical protein